MQISRYRQTIAETESSRQIERRVLVETTNSLERYQPEFDEAKSNLEKLSVLSSGLRDSIWRNEKLWIMLRDDLASPENRLDQKTRANLISIALWVEWHSLRIFRGEQKVQPLILVNRSIIVGLDSSLERLAV